MEYICNEDIGGGQTANISSIASFWVNKPKIVSPLLLE
jgi:hypothetical protein